MLSLLLLFLLELKQKVSSSFLFIIITIVIVFIIIFMPVHGSPGEMQWKVALCQGRDCQYSLNRVTAVPSEAGPARARKGCSTAWYTLHSQSTSQGWLPAGSNRLLSRHVNSSVKATGSRPLPNLADHQHDSQVLQEEVEEEEADSADGYTDICSVFCLFSSHCCTKMYDVGAHNHPQFSIFSIEDKQRNL